MNTKEKILKEALTLFSEKGYSAVYVGDIAAAVGIKAPSLYKHYKSKQAVFDSCVEVFSERMEQIRAALHLPGSSQADISYQTADTKTITRIAVDLFMFYWKDEVAAKFRRMLMIERYHEPALNELFEKMFIDDAVKHEEKIFSDLIEARVIRREDPHVVALRFYTPIFYLLQKYDMHPDMVEEAKEELTSAVEEFCRTYKFER